MSTDIPEDPNQALIYLLGVMIIAMTGVLTFTIKAYMQAKAANEAVNNVGPGDKRLYDKITSLSKSVEEISSKQNEFDVKGWPTLPQDLNSASGLTETIRNIQHSIEDLSERLRIHDEWERSVKHADD